MKINKNCLFFFLKNVNVSDCSQSRQKVVTVQKKKQKQKHVMRKQIFCQNLYSVVSDQVRHKPGCTATEDR